MFVYVREGIYIMRDTKRIKTFCERLSFVWLSNPNLRFGQLIETVFSKIKQDGKDAYYLEEDEMLNYIDSMLEDNSFDTLFDVSIENATPKNKFFDIPEKEIAIGFKNKKQLKDLIDKLKSLDYKLGTNNSSLDELLYYYRKPWDDSFEYISLDRSKTHCPYNYVSYGIGYEDKVYYYNDIDWRI